VTPFLGAQPALPPAPPSPAIRRAYRRPDRGVLGGVAAGLAEHMGVRVGPLRVCFVLLTAAGGLGVALYGAYWIVLPTPPGVRGRVPPRLEYVLGTAVALIAVVIVATLSTMAAAAGKFSQKRLNRPAVLEAARS